MFSVGAGTKGERRKFKTMFSTKPFEKHRTCKANVIFGMQILPPLENNLAYNFKGRRIGGFLLHCSNQTCITLVREHHSVVHKWAINKIC